MFVQAQTHIRVQMPAQAFIYHVNHCVSACMRACERVYAHARMYACLVVKVYKSVYNMLHAKNTNDELSLITFKHT